MIDRIKQIMEMENLSPSQFADEIDIQRSSLSHVLSGRNKPSLDFVMKVKKCFTDVNLEWLMFGQGEMLVSNDGVNSNVNNDFNTGKHQTSIMENVNVSKEEINMKNTDHVKGKVQEMKGVGVDDEELNGIERIVFFFKNGTFRSYHK